MRLLSAIIGTRSRRSLAPQAASQAPAEVHAGAQRLQARRMCAALDRAVALGLFEHAERVAASAAALAPAYPPLAERLARLRLRQGRRDAALAIVQACGRTSASLRLLRVACLLSLGRKLEAHLDLLDWCRKSCAPLDARVLLALLEAQAGHRRAAVLTLHQNLKRLEDPRTLQTLLLLSIQFGREQQTWSWAARLKAAPATRRAMPDLSLMLASLGLDGAQAITRTGSEQAHLLAMELVSAESVIESLVEAQRRRLDRGDAGLLAHALDIALPDLADRVGAVEALARLRLLLGDATAAMAWIDRGLAMNAMSVTMNRLKREAQAALDHDAATAAASAMAAGRLPGRPGDQVMPLEQRGIAA